MPLITMPDSLPANQRYARGTLTTFIDRLAFCFLLLLALTFAFEIPLTNTQVGSTALSDSLTSVKILEIGTIGLWLLSHVISRSRPILPPRRLLLPVVIWLAALVISAALSPEYLTHTLRFLSRIGQGLLIAWIAYDLTSRTRWLTVLRILVVAGALIGLLGLGEAAGIPVVLNFLMLFRDTQTHVGDMVRVSASLPYATIAAMVLEMLISFTIAWLVVTRNRLMMIALGFILTVEIAALILTLTRTALVGLAAALLLMAFASALLKSWRTMQIALGAIGISVVGIGLLLVLKPTAGLRLSTDNQNGWYQAQYNAPAAVSAHPNELITVPIRLTNEGLLTWQATTPATFKLAYTLTKSGDSTFTALDGLRTPLPADLPPTQTIDLNAQVVAPAAAGEYLIQWDMLEENVLWFSWRGSTPDTTRLTVSGDPVVSSQPTHLQPANHTIGAPIVERPALWNAALLIFRDHPLFGIGPDDYRWVYGRYLSLDQWDTNVHANSIYVEMLADTGLIGLIAFLWMNGQWLWLAWQRIRQQTDLSLRVWHLALLAALVAWFVHGILDYFYEFAGTYILFWLVAGLALNQFSVRELVQPPMAEESLR